MAAAPSYPTRMAFRIMLRTGLRVSEALSLRRTDLRLNQDPPVISVRPESPGNKARKGREVPVPADLLEGPDPTWRRFTPRTAAVQCWTSLASGSGRA